MKELKEREELKDKTGDQHAGGSDVPKEAEMPVDGQRLPADYGIYHEKQIGALRRPRAE